MERIEQNIDLDSDRLIFLYGINTTDRFITDDYRDVDIHQALYELLRKKGFECILFYSHTGSITFMDEHSRDLCRIPSTNAAVTPEKPIRFRGPMGNKRSQILVEREAAREHGSASQANSTSAIRVSDTGALELMDTVMKDEEKKSAVIICQAETAFRNFISWGAQADRMGKWVGLSSLSNKNKCILIFNCDDLGSKIDDNPDFIPIPAFQSLLKKGIPESRQTILKIPGPYKPEVERMMQLVRITQGKIINWQECDRLATTISNDGENAQYWMSTFSHKVKALDCKSITPHLSSARGDSHLLSWKDKLERLVGLTTVKQAVKKLSNLVDDRNKRQQAGLISAHSEPLSLHLAFLGNPGTGKTTVARLVGEMYHDLGLLRRGHVVSANCADLIEEHVGGSARRTDEFIKNAYDGVLFIDEAHQLISSDFGKEVIGRLLTALEDDRHRLAVVLAGYTHEMGELFTKPDVGLRSRIPKKNEIEFPDYLPDELFEILQRFLTDKGLITTPEFNHTVKKIITQMYEDRDVARFGNARAMRKLADDIEKLRANRIKENNLDVYVPIIEDDLPEEARAFLVPSAPDKDDIMAELNQLIGLDTIKQTISNMVDKLVIQPVREKLGQPIATSSLNLIFSGNTGTGKTTVAELMGKILKGLGRLREGEVVEVRAKDLIAEYLGQTAVKTEEVCKRALDNILFIDEAYELIPGGQNNYAKDVIGVLMSYIDNYPNRLVVIAAGYPDEMDAFIRSNPGLVSRFSLIDFPDYSNDELLEILELKVSKQKTQLPDATKQRAKAYFETERDKSNRTREPFLNARLVDQLLEIMETNQNQRFLKTGETSELQIYLPEDIPDKLIAHQYTAQYGYQHYDLVSRLPKAKTTCIDDALNACCLIEVTEGDERGTGTGFIVSEDGHMITAYHVIKGATTIQARLNGQDTMLPVTIVGTYENWDIAILRLPDNRSYPYVTIAPEGYQAKVAQEIYVLGYPLGERWGTEITFTKGPISSLRENNDVLQVDASMTYGSSGGPILAEENGYVLGIVHGGDKDIRSGMNFAISTQIIYRFFSDQPATQLSNGIK